MWWIAAIAIIGPEATDSVKTVQIEQSTVASIGGWSVGLVSIRTGEDSVGVYHLAKISLFKPGTEESKTRMTGKGNKFKIGDACVEVQDVVPAQGKDKRGYIVLEVKTSKHSQ